MAAPAGAGFPSPASFSASIATTEIVSTLVVITTISPQKKRCLCLANRFQYFDQLPELLPPDASDVALEEFRERFIDGLDQLQPVFGDAADHHAPVLAAALPLNELARLEAVEEPGDIWVGRDHSFGGARAVDALLPRSTKNAKVVVRGGGELNPFKKLGCPLLDNLVRPKRVE